MASSVNGIERGRLATFSKEGFDSASWREGRLCNGFRVMALVICSAHVWRMFLKMVIV